MSTTTSVTSTTPAPPVRSRAALGAPSLARLTALELRKTVDTRGARWLLAALALLAAAALGYQLVTGTDDPLTFERTFGSPMAVVRQVLPVLGVLVMTTEWTNRTALTTFGLTPRRGRVVAAKLAAVLGVALAAPVLVAAATAAAALVAGSVTGEPVAWDGAAPAVGGAAVASALAMLLGAGLGALLQQAAGALVVYFLAPVLVAVAGEVVLGGGVQWVSVLSVLADVRDLDLDGALAPALVATGSWIALPLAAGVVRTLRREVS